MKRTLAALTSATMLAGAAVATMSTSATAAPAPTQAFGITADRTLVGFDVKRPGQADRIAKVTGLKGDKRLVGLDFRVKNKTLYEVGNNGGIYTINTRTADADRVGRLSAPLRGVSFGVDVNPAADALRIVSNAGQNLRYSFAEKTTTVDGRLNTPDVADPVRGIKAAAYTNNDNSDKTGTALFDLNATLGNLSLQVPANAGTITPQGSTGRKLFGQVGFDIATGVTGGKATSNNGFASFTSGGTVGLWTVDLTTGDLRKVGSFPKGAAVTDFSVVVR